MSIPANTLLSEGQCLASCTPDAGFADAMELALLRRIVNFLNPMVATDSNTLLTEAGCYSCYGTTLAQTLKLALLNLILQNLPSGGVGSSCLFCGTVDPVNVPPCPCAIFYNRSSCAWWYWDADTASWKTFIV